MTQGDAKGSILHSTIDAVFEEVVARLVADLGICQEAAALLMEDRPRAALLAQLRVHPIPRDSYGALLMLAGDLHREDGRIK